MKTYVMPGYGDRSDYLKLSTWNWKLKYGIEREVVVFGWNGRVETAPNKLEAFEQKLLAEPEPVNFVAISASGSPALYAKQKYPEKVGRITLICSPVHQKKMNQDTLHNDYPILEYVLGKITLDGLPKDDIRIYYSPDDTVAPQEAVLIEGVDSRPIGHANHALTIGHVMFTRSGEIAHFLKGE